MVFNPHAAIGKKTPRGRFLQETGHQEGAMFSAAGALSSNPKGLQTSTVRTGPISSRVGLRFSSPRSRRSAT